MDKKGYVIKHVKKQWKNLKGDIMINNGEVREEIIIYDNNILNGLTQDTIYKVKGKENEYIVVRSFEIHINPHRTPGGDDYVSFDLTLIVDGEVKEHEDWLETETSVFLRPTRELSYSLKKYKIFGRIEESWENRELLEEDIVLPKVVRTLSSWKHTFIENVKYVYDDKPWISRK